MEKTVLIDWKAVTRLKVIPEDTKFINVDTRDFHLAAWNHDEFESCNFKELQALSPDKSGAMIKRSDIIKLIKDVKKHAGEEGVWRHIHSSFAFCDRGEVWLKYIHFLHAYDDMYICYFGNRPGEFALLNVNALREYVWNVDEINLMSKD